jgi:7-cyano-7-deazaguanine synthase in queuosine biosynthesis
MNQVNVPFDKSWKNVAVSLSGGADSALLAYMVCELVKDQGHDVTVHIINHVRMWKTRPWQQHDADQVYNWLTKRFGEITFKRHNNFIAPDIEYGNIGPNLTDEYGKKVSGDNIQQRAYAEFVCEKHDVDAYYNAVTRNPRLAQFNGMRERDIERDNNNTHLEYMIHMGRVASHPFRFVDKSWVLCQYNSLNLMELFDITRSCEGEFAEINYKTYKYGQYVPTCGECFWCKERAWAIEQYNK